ncbi:MAG: hypothetical protein ABWY33_09965 [Cellulomonas sp.]
MSERPTAPDDVPDLPESLDGLDDHEPKNAPPAIQDPTNPDAHGPLIQA